jgi:hypothetical protein
MNSVHRLKIAFYLSLSSQKIHIDEEQVYNYSRNTYITSAITIHKTKIKKKHLSRLELQATRKRKLIHKATWATPRSTIHLNHRLLRKSLHC